MSSNPRLIRTVYRAMLRASGGGRHPQVFGDYASHVVPKDTPLPSDAKQVCALLRNAFGDPLRQVDMFSALRRSNELSSILHPRALPDVLPIFDYNSTALMGEELDFNFFEPRYKLLAKEATTSCSGMFVLRARMSPASENVESDLSILVKIIRHQELPAQNGGNVLVQCLAGPRVRVLEQEQVPVDVQDAPPLTRATQYVLEHDDDSYSDASMTDLLALRSYSLELLSKFVKNRHHLLYAGLPPITVEDYSFWALRFVLAHNDSFSRLTWLSCRSTQERLIFIINLLESFQQVTDKNKDSDSSNSSDDAKM